MCQLLSETPVQVLEVRSADDLRSVHLLALERHFQVYVVSGVAGELQIRQRFWLLLGTWSAKRLERFESHDPRRDRAHEVLGEKRPERHVLPRLNVASTPVVEQY